MVAANIKVLWSKHFRTRQDASVKGLVIRGSYHQSYGGFKIGCIPLTLNIMTKGHHAGIIELSICPIFYHPESYNVITYFREAVRIIYGLGQ